MCDNRAGTTIQAACTLHPEARLNRTDIVITAHHNSVISLKKRLSDERFCKQTLKPWIWTDTNFAQRHATRPDTSFQRLRAQHMHLKTAMCAAILALHLKPRHRFHNMGTDEGRLAKKAGTALLSESLVPVAALPEMGGPGGLAYRPRPVGSFAFAAWG